MIEQHTAALFGPYADAPGTSGGTFYEPGEFAGLVTELDARRFQVLIHAVGDRGVHVALDAIGRARQVNGPRDARHQLMHIELAAAGDLPRFAELGVTACMQPRHCAADVGGAEWRGQQAVSLRTALSAYTTGGAYANFCENDRGSLTPGKAADLIVLSDNLFGLDPVQIRDCRVDLTMIAGQVQSW